MAITSIGNNQSSVSGEDKSAIKTLAGTDGRHLYEMDGQKFNIESLIFYVESKIATTLDGQLKDKRDKLEAGNQKLDEANQILKDLRDNRPKGTDSSDNMALDPHAREWLKTELGSNPPAGDDGKLNQGQWDQLTENVKAHIDNLNSTHQIDTVDTDALTKHHSEIYEFLSNYSSILARDISTVINNLRSS